MKSQATIKGNTVDRKGSPLAFAFVTSLFFAWGFLTCMNDVLIPYLQKAFSLSIFEATLVQFAFFMAYTVGSIIYYFISVAIGDPLARIGYQNGIVIGLFLAGTGALLFYPAGALLSYPLFLGALFVLALGFTMLQISANPYVAVLGDESSASSRLNLSQGFNSLGTTIAPLIGGYFILRNAGESVGADSVRMPYLAFAGTLFLLGLVFLFIRLPRIEGGGKVPSGFGALRYPHVIFGMLAIFFYVGAEVSVGSLLVKYLGLPKIAGLNEDDASVYLSVYWGGLMIGRFLGAISLSDSSWTKKLVLMVFSAVGCFALILLATYIKDARFGWDRLWPYTLLVVLNFGAFLFGRSNPSRTLMVFALVCIALLVTTVFTTGNVAMWSVLGVGLFNSIMWSNIFTLAIAGLGEYKSQGSSLLVMMIIGGALLPPAQGALADAVGIQYSYLLPIVAYLYLAWYGLDGYRVRPPRTSPT